MRQRELILRYFPPSSRRALLSAPPVTSASADPTRDIPRSTFDPIGLTTIHPKQATPHFPQSARATLTTF